MNMERSDVDQFIHKARGILNTLVLNSALLKRTAADHEATGSVSKLARYADLIDRDIRRLAAHLTELDPTATAPSADDGAR